MCLNIFEKLFFTIVENINVGSFGLGASSVFSGAAAAAAGVGAAPSSPAEQRSKCIIR